MSSLIQTPTAVDDILKELSLKYSEYSILQTSVDHVIIPRPEVEQFISGILPPAPKVTVRKPLWWHLTPKLKHLARTTTNKALANDLNHLLRDSQLYLAMVACSFQPEIDCQINYARLSCYLRPQLGASNPTVLDVYPHEVKNTDFVNLPQKIILTNELIFSTSNVQGDGLFIIESKNINPLIKSNHHTETSPYWEYFSYEQKPIIDYRFGYMIIRKPLAVKAVRLTLDIIATVITPYGRYNASVKEKDKPFLSQIICPEYIEIH